MKKLFALLTLILTAATLARSGRDGERAYLYDPLPVILPEGINHLLDNSQSELEEMKGFDRVVERFMQRWEITGASIAVMKNGRLLYSKGYGWADKERNVRTDVKHIFRIASLSKLITATGHHETAGGRPAIARRPGVRRTGHSLRLGFPRNPRPPDRKDHCRAPAPASGRLLDPCRRSAVLLGERRPTTGHPSSGQLRRHGALRRPDPTALRAGQQQRLLEPGLRRADQGDRESKRHAL